MWRCAKCGEELEDTFDACWNCGTSMDGVEDPGFQVEAPAVESAEAVDGRVGWDSFFIAGAITAILALFNYVVPLLVSPQSSSLTRSQLGAILAARLWQSAIFGVVGGFAGWVGGRSDRLVVAARRGAGIFVGMLCLCMVLPPSLLQTSIPTIIAVAVNFVALGAIAATVGSIVGRRRRRKSLGEPLQYSLADMLFLMLLATLLFASLAVLLRQG